MDTRRTGALIVTVCLLATACGGGAAPTTTTTAPATTMTQGTTTPPTTTTAPPTTTTAALETVVVTFDGALHPHNVTFEPGQSGVMEIRNETDSDWEVVSRDADIGTLVLAAGGSVAIDFGVMERGIYHLWVQSGQVRVPTVVDNQGIVFSSEDMEAIASWDGRLSIDVLEDAAGDWDFEAVADGVIAFPSDSDPEADRLGQMAAFFAALTSGGPLAGEGLVLVVQGSSGDTTAAGERGAAALAADPTPEDCSPPVAAPVEHSGLQGEEYRYSCGEATLTRGYLVAPGDSPLLVFYDAVTADASGEFQVATALGSIVVDPAGALESEAADDFFDIYLGYRESAALFDTAGEAVVAIGGYAARPAIGRVGPWNAGPLVFRNEDDLPYTLTWQDGAAAVIPAGGEIPARGDLAVTLPTEPDGVYAYTISFGRTGRMPGWIDAWASSPQLETVTASGGGFTIAVPEFGEWVFRGDFTDSISGEPRHVWGREGDFPWILLTLVDAEGNLYASDQDLLLTAASSDAAQLAAGGDCRQQSPVAITRGDMIGGLAVMECPSGPPEVGVMYLVEPGTRWLIRVSYGIEDEEGRFYLEAALAGLVLTPPG
jgi:hypothetical protein